MQVKATRSCKELFHNRVGNVWISYYHHELVDFDVIVDHLALVHILKSKAEPATTRIKRLLEVYIHSICTI